MVSLSTTRRNSGVTSLAAHGYCAEHAGTAIARAAFLEPPGSAKQKREYPTKRPVGGSTGTARVHPVEDSVEVSPSSPYAFPLAEGGCNAGVATDFCSPLQNWRFNGDGGYRACALSHSLGFEKWIGRRFSLGEEPITNTALVSGRRV